MRVRILLQVAAGDADFAAAEEVATFEKRTVGIEALGLSLAEGKLLLATTQQRVIVDRRQLVTPLIPIRSTRYDADRRLDPLPIHTPTTALAATRGP